MKNSKRLLALLLALVLCLSMAACGGKEPEETTAPAAQTNDIWSEETLAGVEHVGNYIVAGTATQAQVMYAAVRQGQELDPLEGYTYLKPYVIYFDMVDEEGSWHYPAMTYLPGDETGDNIYYNSYNAVKAEYGNVVASVQIQTWGLTEEEKEVLSGTPGWEALTQVQLQLCYALELRLEEDGLTLDSEGVEVAYDEDSSFGSWCVETEAGTKRVIAQFYLSAQGTDGNNAISLVEVQGPVTDDANENPDYYMTEQDIDLLNELFYIYELDKWYD